MKNSVLIDETKEEASENSIWLSIVIPIYNPQIDLLERCIDSIKGMNIPLEIILINDGSSFSLDDILEKIIRKESRIVIYEQDNQGVSAARNLGISKAKGKYLFFLDADDMISNELIELLNINWQEIDSDWVLFNIEEKHEIEKSIFNRIIISETKQYELNYIIEKKIKTTELNECWGKLIKREVITNNGIAFPIGVKQGEDSIFNNELLRFIKSVQGYAISGYIYTWILHNDNRLFSSPVNTINELKILYHSYEKLVLTSSISNKEDMLIWSKNRVLQVMSSNAMKLNVNKMLSESIKEDFCEAVDALQVGKKLHLNKTQGLIDRLQCIALFYRLWWLLEILSLCYKIKKAIKRI